MDVVPLLYKFHSYQDWKSLPYPVLVYSSTFPDITLIALFSDKGTNVQFCTIPMSEGVEIAKHIYKEDGKFFQYQLDPATCKFNSIELRYNTNRQVPEEVAIMQEPDYIAGAIQVERAKEVNSVNLLRLYKLDTCVMISQLDIKYIFDSDTFTGNDLWDLFIKRIPQDPITWKNFTTLGRYILSTPMLQSKKLLIDDTHSLFHDVVKTRDERYKLFIQNLVVLQRLPQGTKILSFWYNLIYIWRHLELLTPEELETFVLLSTNKHILESYGILFLPSEQWEISEAIHGMYSCVMNCDPENNIYTRFLDKEYAVDDIAVMPGYAMIQDLLE